MKGLGAILALASAVAAGPAIGPRQQGGGGSRTPPITVRGNAFWQGDRRFYIRGIDYQPGGASNAQDPLADPRVCRRDIEKFRQLGINTVRIYTVDNSKSHEECMRLLSEAGIYLALDVNTPMYSINRADPAPSYNDVYLQSVFATVDIFQQYDNTLLFFSANEVINDELTSNTAPFVKAVTRDIRAYIKAHNYRPIPVGYSAADVEANRFETAQYMNCGGPEERSDFFAFNDYSWCDPSDFVTAGWDKKVEQFGNYSIPLFLSEYGCITNTREFNEIEALYSDQMTGVYSGGLVYEYTEEANGYGIIQLNRGQIRELPDFRTLREKFAATRAPTTDGGFREGNEPSVCPERTPAWDVDPDVLPAIPEPAQKYMTEKAGRGPGLGGSGSQYAGTPSSEDQEAGNSAEGAAEGGDGEGAATSVRVSALSAAVAVSALIGAAIF